MYVKAEEIFTKELVDRSGFGARHYQCEIRKGLSAPIIGFGSAFSAELAIKKALFELCERFVLHHDSRLSKFSSSNGFAAHCTDDLARQSAKFELIERHFFISNWLRKRAPLWISTESNLLSENTLFLKMSEAAESRRIGIRVGIVIEDPATGIISLVGAILPKDDNQKFGLALTSACGNVFADVLSSILLTLSRYISTIVVREADSGVIPISTSIVQHPRDHFEHYLSPAQLRHCKWFFENSSGTRPTQECLSNIQTISPADEFHFPLPVSVIKAFHPDAQEYFAGPSAPGKINIPISEVNNWELHPLP